MSSDARRSEWTKLGWDVDTLFTNSFSSLWSLQCGWHVAESAVEGFSRNPWPVPMDASRVRGRIEIYEEGKEQIVATELLSTLLPQYCVILSVAIMDAFLADYRSLFPKARRRRDALLSLPVPPWIIQGDDLDAILYPRVARFVELRAARHLFVHNAGIIDQQYLDTAAGMARGPLGGPYPLCSNDSWEALGTCSDLLVTIRSLWAAVLPNDDEADPIGDCVTGTEE